MLSHASKGHNLILMISYIFRVILNCTMTSLTLCCLVMTLPLSLCYSNVVNKHQLLALSVLCLYCGINKNYIPLGSYAGGLINHVVLWYAVRIL